MKDIYSHKASKKLGSSTVLSGGSDIFRSIIPRILEKKKRNFKEGKLEDAMVIGMGGIIVGVQNDIGQTF